MNCPTCDSPSPHLHPAIQFEGEVETCVDNFHLKETPQNTKGYQNMVLEKRAAKTRAALDAARKAGFIQ